MFGIDDAVAAGLKVLDKFVPDPAAKAQAAIELRKLVNEAALAQIGTNTAEVQSGSVLGKWRGALGWALAGSAVYQFVLYPFLIALLLAVNPAFPVEKVPVLDWKQIGTILMGMLGLGG